MIHRHLFLAAILAATAAPLAAQNVRAGIEAWQRADYAAAVAIWRPLAEAGDADAQFNLGQSYRLGRGLAINLAVAKTWFERAADKGHVDAQTTLGLLLFQNGNRVAALRWLKGAADLGEPRAMLVYGTALYNGDGVPQDQVTAYAMVSRAAAQGLPPAQATLADLDAAMPLEQRQKGVALAKAMAGGKPDARGAAPKSVAPKAVAAKPVAAKPVAAKPPAPVTAKPVVVATGGGWRIQLGAFGQRGSAEGLFAKVAGKLGGAQPYYVPVGKIVRLQAGPYASRAAAASACKQVTPQPCFPVETR